eukprot:CAMPEP_0113875496 /NCGR_PEP_ID=MMETSP0780_2-20120614/4977_1 /TAXON_ID=652834 /ORGANISM="Palpitomonas bilix" /LENGTH=486 /DNA_ID=CAMNT_0000861497 /DNA_START=192 /DNA_END=1652 /DNA_ORIENTATION=- /assembly_acc=CAM_ASM_000599
MDSKSHTPLLSIPLKPTDKPVDLPDDFKKHIKNEYATRYLESIGAAATPDAIKRVMEQLPLQKCDVNAAFKSRGGLSDVIYIKPPESTSSAPSNTVNSQELFAVVQRKAEEDAKRAKDKSATGELGGMGGPDLTFGQFREKYLHTPPLGDKAGGGRGGKDNANFALADRLGSRQGKGGAGAVGGVNAADMEDDSKMTEADLELRQPLAITIEDVLAIQTMFTRTFPFYTLRSRLTEDDVAMAVAEITSLQVAQLIADVCRLMYNDLTARKRAPSEVTEEKQEKLLLSIYEAYMDLQSRLKRRSHRLVLLPLLLLSLRVTVETIFRNSFPKWIATPDGEASLQKVDVTITALFDPDRYRSHVSLLESSVEAMRVVNKDPRYAKKSIKEKFFTVSPLVRSLMTDPQSGDARYILSQGQRQDELGQTEKGETSPLRGAGLMSGFGGGREGRGGERGDAESAALVKSRQQLFREALQRAERRLSKRSGFR